MSTLNSRITAVAAIYGQAPPMRPMSEHEFDAWIDSKTRAEWVDGEVVMMAPAAVDHDDIVGWLVALLKIFVAEKGAGTVHGPEVLVRLESVRRKRLPDIAFVSIERAAIVEKTEIAGAPDLIIEVVSPDSIERDWFEKYADYEQAGVKEYWVIDRLAGRVECYKRKPAGFLATKMRDGRLASTAIKGFYLRPEWVTRTELPRPLHVLRELGVVA